MAHNEQRSLNQCCQLFKISNDQERNISNNLLKIDQNVKLLLNELSEFILNKIFSLKLKWNQSCQH